MKPCVRTWEADELARDADLILLGSYNDMLPNEPSSKAPQCGGPFSHDSNRGFVRALRDSPRSSVASPRAIHMTRFELISPAHLQAEGFSADFLLKTTTPLSRIERFFEADQSSSYRGECRFTFRPDRGNQKLKVLMDSAIDARGATAQHERSVYYISMRHRQTKVFSPHAVLADLRNPAYRASRVDRARRAIAAGEYDPVMLNNKFDQYYARSGFWLGSAACPDVARCTNGNGNIFSARSDGYAEYVEGRVSLARDLDAANVPYVVALASNPWLSKADSRATPDIDERAAIRSVLARADTVLLSASNVDRFGSIDRWAASLRQEGANVVPVDETFGYAKSSVN